MQLVQVDVVGPESPQASLAARDHVVVGEVVRAEVGVPDLGREQKPVTATAQHAPKDLLRPTERPPVGVGGVDQVHARVEGGVGESLRELVVDLRAPREARAEGHRPERHLGHAQAPGAESACLHAVTLSNCMGAEQFDGCAGPVITRLAKLVDVTVMGFDLSLAQYRMLGFLAEGTAASSSLAESMAVTRPSVSSLVDGLVARGLVDRGEDPADRRRQLIRLTPAGEAAAVAIDQAVCEHLELVVAELDDERAEAVRVAFADLQVALDRYRERVRAGVEAAPVR